MNSTSAASRTAAVIVALEGIGLLLLAGVQIAAILGGDVESALSAVALIVLTFVGAASVLAFAVAIWRGLSWGRSGGIVTQVLIIGVAFGAATGAYAQPITGLLLAMPAVAALVLLVISARPADPRHGAGDAPD